MEVYVRQFATACRNMWAGAMIPYDTRKRNQEAKNKGEKYKNTPSIATIDWLIKYQSCRSRKLEKREPTDTPPLQELSTIIAKLKSTKSDLVSQKSKKPAVSSSRETEEDETDEVQLNDEDAEWERCREEGKEDEKRQKDGKKKVEDGEEVLTFRSHQAGEKRPNISSTSPEAVLKKRKTTKDTSRSRL
ncbi:hypothetical protein DFQ30_009300 [Apophysomyces sp. BC1015]|nr:hypothetical protein DFQ30_009300 [Apophysomyces sp. BC1015]